VRGEGTIIWKNTSNVPQSEIYLHLYLNAFKNEKSIYMRNLGRGFRGDPNKNDFGWIRISKLFAYELDKDLWTGVEQHSPGDPDDETEVRVPLPRPIAPGQILTMDVAWLSDLPSVSLRTGFEDSFHMVGQWFPKLAKLEADGKWAHFPFYRYSEFYADFGAYDVTIDVPEGYVVGATGKLESEKKQNGRVERRFVQENVHDFAFTAWDKFKELTAKSDDGVAIRCLYPPGYDKAAENQVEAAKFGLTHFGAAYGKYPHATLTLVHPPRGAEEAGGMEYPTLITTGGDWYADKIGIHSVELVTLHELGHQWFQGMVATNEHAYPFQDEGFNQYAEGVASEVLWPRASGARLFGVFAVSVPQVVRLSAIEVQHNDEVAESAAKFASGGDYGALVYSRTATILNTTARVYGEDQFRRALGVYTRRYRFGHPTPNDMLAVFREELGADAAENMRIAFFERGWVDYGVAEVVSTEREAMKGVFGDPEKPGTAPVVDSLYHGRVLVRRRGTLVFPVDIDLVLKDGTVKRVHWDGQGTTFEIPYEGSQMLTHAIVDPDHRVYLDSNLLDNARAISSRSVAPRVLSKGAMATEVLLHLLAP
jgi:Peptidase family M1 domain